MASQGQLFLAAAEAAGLPPAMLAQARDNPALLQMLLSTLKDKMGGASLPQPGASEKTETDALIAQLDAAKKVYERDRNRPPVQPPAGNRNQSVVHAASMKEHAISMRSDGRPQIKQTTTGVPKSFSSTPLHQLRRIDFKDLWAPKTHKGCFVLARIISVPATLVGTGMIVEDPPGRAEYFSIYNYPLHGVLTGPDLDALFPLGQVLAIREPTYKPQGSGQGYNLRVDSPSDVHFLPPTDPLLKNVRWAFSNPAKPRSASFDHKAHGNTLFKKQKYLLASKAYSEGLVSSSSADQKLLLHLNRAQAHLRLGNFASAFRDASAVLSMLDDDVNAPPQTLVKAKLRLARALEGLQLLDQAKDAYDAVVEADGSIVEGKDGKKRVEKMLREVKTGGFDFRELEDALLPGAPDLEVGDYVGPIKAVELEGRGGGRGIVTTRDVSAGELLLVEKVFAVGRPDIEKDGVIIALNLHRNRAEKGSDLALAGNIAARIMDDSSTADFVYSLYGGDDHPASRTLPLASLAQRKVGKEDRRVDVDIARIEAIAIQNRFGLRDSEHRVQSRHDTASGLFLSASLANHSCAPTADWTTFRNLMVVRARTAIAAGAEVQLAYINAGAPTEVRDGVLGTHFDNGCTCSLCNADRADGAVKLRRRRELMEKRFPALEEAYSRVNGTTITALDGIRRQLRDMTAFVKDLEQTYSASHGPLKPDLAAPYLILAELQLPTLASFSRIEVLAAPLGMRDNAVGALLRCASRLEQEGGRQNLDEAARWIGAALQMARILDGDSKERFKERYEMHIRRYKLEKVVEAAAAA
ncbi:hypothetical protein JCM8097_001541 [Rhodosporidiobolus ruineniae]